MLRGEDMTQRGEAKVRGDARSIKGGVEVRQPNGILIKFKIGLDIIRPLLGSPIVHPTI